MYFLTQKETQESSLLAAHISVEFLVFYSFFVGFLYT